jgi:outer membrane cobalamin receptor
MTKILSSFLTIFFLLWSIQSSAETKTGNPPAGVVSGVVLDNQTGLPVEYANVVLYHLPDSGIAAGTVTSPEGRYILKNVQDGAYYLSVYFIGYAKKIIPDITLNRSKREINLEPVRIDPVSQQLNEVTVSADQNSVEYKIDKKVVNVGQNLNNAGGTAVDALRNVPGVNVDNDGNVTVRGSGSFTVLVDGKPTVLEGSEALKQIPASSVGKIEVITNPSAKYDAEGTSGIINVLMKKNTNVGLNGVINASMGSRDKYTADFLLNFKRQKINYFCGFNYRNTTNLSYTDTYKESTVRTDTTDFLDSRMSRTMTYRSYMGKAGFDYTLNGANSISLSTQVGQVDFDGFMNTKYNLWTNPVTQTAFSINKEHMEVFGNYLLTNLSFQHKFNKPGHELNATALYSYWEGERNEFNTEYPTTANWENESGIPDQTRRLRDEDKTEIRLKLDYILPLDSVSKLEAGFQSNLKPLNNSQKYEALDNQSGNWNEDASFQDKLSFKQNIHALYGTFTSQYKGFEYQAGLRTEYTDRNLEQKVMDKKYPYTQLDFFPSASVSRQLKNNLQIQLSYSRRINRPNEQLLNPLPMYSDKYTSMLGNPDLKPEFIDSYELNLMKRLKKGFYSIETYFRQNNNTFNQMIHVNQEGNYYIDYGNIDKTYSLGMDVSGNFDLAKWFTIAPAVSVFAYQYKSDNITYDVPDWPVTANARINATFRINPTTRIQLNGFINAPVYDVQGWQDYFYFGGISARKDFFKRLTVVVNYNNPFGIYQYHSENRDINLYNTFHIWNEPNVVLVSLSYKINNYKPVRRAEEAPDLNIN